MTSHSEEEMNITDMVSMLADSKGLKGHEKNMVLNTNLMIMLYGENCVSDLTKRSINRIFERLSNGKVKIIDSFYKEKP